MTEDYEARWKNHWKRWNIPTPVFDFKALRHRVFAALSRVFHGEFVKPVCEEFELLRGLPHSDLPYAVSNNAAFINFPSTQLGKSLLQEDDLYMNMAREEASWLGWVTTLQCFFWALAECVRKNPPSQLSGPVDRSARPLAKRSIAAIEKAIAMSPGAPVAMKAVDYSVTLFPRGAKFLDDGLVNDTLGWLGGHPDAKSHFEKALAIYLKDDKTQFRNLLDELRKAMEEVLRSILGNSKSLENQKDLLGKWLDGKGVHAQVRNTYMTLLKQFADYQNDAVKHGDAWSESEVEYMIYLTGTFMRMLLVLNGDSKQINRDGS